MIKNKQGQALIEFVLILPVLLLIMTSIFDIGTILYKKYIIQNELDVITGYINNEEEENAKMYAKKNNINIIIEKKDDLINVKADYNLKLITPGLGRILGNPYKIKEEKTIFKNNKIDDTNELDNTNVPLEELDQGDSNES